MIRRVSEDTPAKQKSAPDLSAFARKLDAHRAAAPCPGGVFRAAAAADMRRAQGALRRRLDLALARGAIRQILSAEIAFGLRALYDDFVFFLAALDAGAQASVDERAGHAMKRA